MNFFNELRKESGFTLIETMASLALLAVVIILASGFLMNSHQSRATVANAVEHQRVTTVFVAELRKQYNEANGTGELTFRDLPDGFTIDLIAINGAIKPPASPLTDIRFDEPLSLDVTTVSNTGEKLTIQTTWRPVRPDTLSLTP